MYHSQNSIALITGASRRIGRGIALYLAEQGWDICIHCNKSTDEAASLVKEISQLGQIAVIVKADLNDMSEVNKIIPKCIERIGVPSCLVNNASLFENDNLENMTGESWGLHQNINLKAPILLSQAFAAHAESENDNIINIIDQKIKKLTPYFFSYTISKAALWTATQTMAQTLAPKIRVNAIAPGPVLQSIHQTEEQFERQYKSPPLNRGTTPEEIAQAVKFIIDAPAFTGQMIALDGGQHLSWKKAPKDQAD